jgi:AraC-like DNA-binding protein
MKNVPLSEWFAPSLHSGYFQIVSEQLASRNLMVARPFVGQPRLLPLLDFLPILDVVHAVPEPERGMEIGWMIPASAHGPMGFAALSSTTPWDAMGVIAKFGPVRNHLFTITAEKADGFARLSFGKRQSLGVYARFLESATLLAMLQVLVSIVDKENLQSLKLRLPWRESAAQTTFAKMHGIEMEFEAGELAIQCPRSLAETKCKTADAEMHKILCMAGEKELAILQGSFAAKVRHLIQCEQPNWPPLEVVAVQLGCTVRTLARRLESEETSYQSLLDDSRYEVACWSLRHTQLSLGSIAELVGFSLQTNFTRGFTKWAGSTPTQYRRMFGMARA